MAAKRKYYGQAHAAKCYVGPKSVNIVLDPHSASVLAANLLNGVNAGARKIDVKVPLMKGGKAKIGVTVTSREVA